MCDFQPHLVGNAVFTKPVTGTAQAEVTGPQCAGEQCSGELLHALKNNKTATVFPMGSTPSKSECFVIKMQRVQTEVSLIVQKRTRNFG